MAFNGIRKEKSPNGLTYQEAHHGNQSRNNIISACSRSTGDGSEGNQGSCCTPVSSALLAPSVVLWGCWGCRVLGAEHGMRTRSPRAYLPSGTLRLLTKTFLNCRDQHEEVLHHRHRMESWKCHLMETATICGRKGLIPSNPSLFLKNIIYGFISIRAPLKHGKLHFGSMHSFCFGLDDKRKLKNLISSLFALSLNALF